MTEETIETDISLPPSKGTKHKQRRKRKRVKIESECSTGKMPSIFKSSPKDKTGDKSTTEDFRDRRKKDDASSCDRVILPKLPTLETDRDYLKIKKSSSASLGSDILPAINKNGSFTARSSLDNYDGRFISFPIRHHFDHL